MSLSIHRFLSVTGCSGWKKQAYNSNDHSSDHQRRTLSDLTTTMAGNFIIPAGSAERQTDRITDSIHHALVLVKSPTTHPIVSSSSVTTSFPTSYHFGIYHQTTVCVLRPSTTHFSRWYNVGFVEFEGKSVIISDSFNRQSNISYFTFRFHINPHLVDSS